MFTKVKLKRPSKISSESVRVCNKRGEFYDSLNYPTSHATMQSTKHPLSQMTS